MKRKYVDRYRDKDEVRKWEISMFRRYKDKYKKVIEEGVEVGDKFL